MVSLADLIESATAGYWGAEAGTLDRDVAVIRNGDVQSYQVRWSKLPLRAFTTAEAAKSRVHSGDLLITTSGDCGRVAMVESEPGIATCASNFVRRLRFRSDVEPRYLLHYMNSADFRASIAPFVRGTSMQNLATREAFAAAQVPFPTLAEQRRIAAILDHADALRAKRREQSTLISSAIESTFLQMFGDEPAGQTVMDVAESTRTGPFGSQLLHSEFVDEGVAVLGLDNVVSDAFRWGRPRFITEEKYAGLVRYTVEPGDVLISIMGTVGRCAIVPECIPRAINTKHICAVRLDRSRMLPEFLRATFLWHPAARAYLRRQTKGAIMAGLNMGIIRSMPISVVSMERQIAFVNALRSLERSRDMATDAMADLDALFASLQHRAFRGEL